MLSSPTGLSALSLAALLGIVLGLFMGWGFGPWFSRWWGQRQLNSKAWDLSARPVFNRNERRLRRHLVEALPGYLVLPKVPLVRICQPQDPKRTRFWFETLGSMHASFLVCSPAGRTLAAVDLDDGRPVQQRSQRIKEMALKSCEVPYIRCQPGRWPSAVQLQQLVPEPVDLGPTLTVGLNANFAANTKASPGDEREQRPFLISPGVPPAGVTPLHEASLANLPSTQAPPAPWAPTIAEAMAQPVSSLLWRDADPKSTMPAPFQVLQGADQRYLQHKRAPTLLVAQAVNASAARPAPAPQSELELPEQRRA